VSLQSALVVGAGLIGTSVAMALTDAGTAVWIEDVDQGRARVASELGAGRTGRPPEEPDIVIVAVPPGAVGSVVQELSGIYLRCIFTDVASVASIPQADVESLGHDVAQRFVGGHPMSGLERSGPAAARADLFRDRPWVLTPGRESSQRALGRARAVVAACGADLVEMSPQRHDEAVALVSHVPQLVSSLTAARLEDQPEDLVALSGPGVRDVTRIAASDPDLWTGILDANASAVLPVVEDLRRQLDDVAAALATLASRGAGSDEQEQARASVRRALAGGVRGRARIPGKHGGRPTQFAVVTVVVADQPGELARIFAAAAAASVNIEDVTLEHASGHPLGSLLLQVQAGSVGALVEALSREGWTVHS